MVMLVTGNVSPRTYRRRDPVVNPRALRSGTQIHRVTHTRAVPFRTPPRDVFFSIEKSLPHDELQTARTRPNSRQCADAMQDYFPGVSTNTAPTPVSRRESTVSGVQSRCASVPLPKADANNVNSGDTETGRSATAPPYINLSLQLSDLENLNMRADEVATAAIEKEQQKFHAERRLNISSAMGVRQHGSPRYGSFSGTPTRRKRREREHAYLCMKFRERPCLRTESFLNDDLYVQVNNLSRECCDVLGPKACHECDRLNRRSNSALRNEANFPSIHISAANFSTMTLVNRVRPEMNTREVLERLAHGDISRQSLRRHRSSSEKSQDPASSDNTPASRARKTSVSAFQVPDGVGFFTNFTDLTAQIFARKRGQNRHTRPKLINQGVGDTNNLPVITNVELVPKKEWERENPANYFGPPMLSRAEIQRQKSHPRFYAGAQGKYELPEAPSFDEITLKASGARHQRIRQLEARSDTPDSDVSLWSVKSSRKGEEQYSALSEAETDAVDEEAESDAQASQALSDLDNQLELETDSA
ncbi:uncharacterized protein LOC110973137 [Acanthaster planci]|uniref:Uncharacterized protein LOC110973137 n=1 Tax=Acanthaster planci TaxID=133434 RepID=A0A8B7XF60_ACAPL|nr:uncharacterized protein LOC110973137 [Acanthaster planci]